MMDGDGCEVGSSCYATVSPDLANDFQELCVKLGIKTTFQKLKMPTSNPRLQQSYRIGIHRTVPFHTYSKKDFSIKKYTGKVHCVTVKDNLLIVRHNGKVHIGSNCVDAFNLAIYGIIKHFSHLFEQIFLCSVS